MQRILDIDLDFFVHRVAHFTSFDGARLDAAEFPPWQAAEALEFLEQRCSLAGKLPGRAVEHHGEVFGLWRAAIEAGALAPPFHVTHVDAHADLGLGENGYRYLLSDLLWRPPTERWHPVESRSGLDDAMTDGSFLSFAVGARWVSGIDYVYCPGGGDDVHPFLMERLDPRSGWLRLPRLTRDELDRLVSSPPASLTVAEDRLEPPVPFRQIEASGFVASAPYDAIFLTRSPGFTPNESDAIYDAIRAVFVDEAAWAGSPRDPTSRL
jgi:hypothetical protein